MHKTVVLYLAAVRTMLPKAFEKNKVLDVGSLNINWTNRRHLENCDYIGIDLVEWLNVDVVWDICTYDPWYKFWLILCTEMLEHCRDWRLALSHMYNLLKKWWLLVCTCANIARREHWTKERWPTDSPATNDYYRNLDSQDILSVLPNAVIEEDEKREDLRFYIIKR